MAYTGQQIKDWAGSKGYLDPYGNVKNDDAGIALAGDAKQYGVSADQLDSAFGWSGGTASKWLTDHNMGGFLGAPTSTGALPAAAGAAAGAAGGTPAAETTTTTPATGAPSPAPAPVSAAAPAVPGAPAAAAAPAVAAPPPPSAPVYVAPPPPAWMSTPGGINSYLASAAGTMQGPANFQVTDNMLTSKQLEKLLASDSPYLERARTKAAEYSNARGLQNSSIGAGAGEAAAIDAAAPIASSDAGTYFQAARDQFGADNQFTSDANNFQRQGALAALNNQFGIARDQAGYGFQSGENAANRTFQTGERLGTQSFQSGQNALDRSSRLDIANLQETGANTRQGRQIASTEGLTREGWTNDAVEAARGRVFTAGENDKTRAATVAENAAQRAWQEALTKSTQSWQTGENALSRAQDRDLQTQNMDRTDARANASTNAGLLQLYMNSLSNIQNNANLSPEQRAEAITNLGDFFFNQALPAWKKGFADPAAWPDTSKKLTGGNATPSPEAASGSAAMVNQNPNREDGP